MPADSRTSRLQWQNTANRSPIPGKDGGWSRGAPLVSLPELRPQQDSQMNQTFRPPPHRGRLRRPRGICDVWNRSLPVATRLAQQVPRLLPAVEAVVPGRRRPVGQYGKCLLAGTTQAPASPDLFVLLVVRLLESLSVADDRPLTTKWTTPRQQFQRNPGHPGSVLFSVSGSSIKRTTAGATAQADRSAKIWRTPAFHSPVRFSVERKENSAFGPPAYEPFSKCQIGRYIRS